MTATAVGTPLSDEQQAVIEVVNQFVQALALGNAPVLYGLQTANFRANCSYERFQAIVESFRAEQLMGPVTATIAEDLAVADLFLESGAPAKLTLMREGDASWRVVTAGPEICT
jgi:hypothetical protein